jgi:predicted RNase H-like nuclease (RuvC/YqgF family)
MPPEDHKTQKKIQCWIPLDTWDKVVSLGYNSPTVAVTKAFEKLLEDHREDPLTNTLVPPKNPLVSPEIPGRSLEIEGYKENIKALNSEIERLKNVIMNAPDPLELARLQERNEGLNLVISEKEKRIEDLTREVGRLDMFAHYFKNVEAKQIEAPATTENKKWWEFWK